jgi:hypothetical protein
MFIFQINKRTLNFIISFLIQNFILVSKLIEVKLIFEINFIPIYFKINSLCNLLILEINYRFINDQNENFFNQRLNIIFTDVQN